MVSFVIKVVGTAVCWWCDPDVHPNYSVHSLLEIPSAWETFFQQSDVLEHVMTSLKYAVIISSHVSCRTLQLVSKWTLNSVAKLLYLSPVATNLKLMPSHRPASTGWRQKVTVFSGMGCTRSRIFWNIWLFRKKLRHGTSFSQSILQPVLQLQCSLAGSYYYFFQRFPWLSFVFVQLTSLPN